VSSYKPSIGFASLGWWSFCPASGLSSPTGLDK